MLAGCFPPATRPKRLLQAPAPGAAPSGTARARRVGAPRRPRLSSKSLGRLTVCIYGCSVAGCVTRGMRPRAQPTCESADSIPRSRRWFSMRRQSSSRIVDAITVSIGSWRLGSRTTWTSRLCSQTELERMANWSAASSQPDGIIDGRRNSMANESRSRKSPTRGRADLVRLRRMSEAEVARTSPKELTDLPDDFWSEAVVVEPVAKRAMSLRVDEDVLAWFKSSGPRYQSRMNAVLRSYMAHMRKRGRGRGAA